MKEKILEEIKQDLADNYRNDEEVLKVLLEDVINDALFSSNRRFNLDKDEQLKVLKSNIKKAVKTIYLRRGTEDVKSSSQSGESNNYASAIEEMASDIIKQNKRILI